jgi:type IX secretion system PorP/SprF family membrane protein
MKINHQLYTKKRLYLVVTMVSVFASFSAHAQYESMFTQYMFNEMYINPAYVGSHECIAANLLYRNQWVGIEGAPKTQTFSIHGPVSNGKLGMGLSVINDNIGVSHQLAVNANVAYRIRFSQNSVLAFGMQGGFVNDEEKYTSIHTITQGDNQFAADARAFFLPNAGVGIYYSEQRFYAGLSIPRLFENKIVPTQNDFSVTNKSNIKYWHYFLTTGYVFDLNDQLKFKPSCMIRAVQNAPVELDMDANFLLNNFLWIGGSYRTGDAISAMVGFQLTKQLRCGYSYDYTFTPLQKFNSGSHEITLGYNFSFDRNKIISTRYF